MSGLFQQYLYVKLYINAVTASLAVIVKVSRYICIILNVVLSLSEILFIYIYPNSIGICKQRNTNDLPELKPLLY